MPILSKQLVWGKKNGNSDQWIKISEKLSFWVPQLGRVRSEIIDIQSFFDDFGPKKYQKVIEKLQKFLNPSFLP